MTTEEQTHTTDNAEYFKIPSRLKLPVEEFYELVLSQKNWPCFVDKIRILDLRHFETLKCEDPGFMLGTLDGLADSGIIMYRRSKEFFSWVVLDEPAYADYCKRDGTVLDDDPHCRIIVQHQD